MKKYVSLIFGFVLLSLIILFGFGIYLLIGAIWNQFKILDKEISVAILTAATTVLVATLTIVLGKYYERKRTIK